MTRENKIAFIILIAFSLVLTFIGCPEPDIEHEKQTPVAGDYLIGNMIQGEWSITAVTITAKDGKSPGAITIYYNGETALPTASGNYAVTFDVAAANGWNAAIGLAAGTLIISEKRTPVADDYNIGNMIQNEWAIAEVTITPKDGRSPGVITIYYNGEETLPTESGDYVVTFDVMAATGWNAAEALNAGTLIINEKQIPGEDDYDIGNLIQNEWAITAVTISAKPGKSPGAITIYYNGIAALPSVAGEYAVTFNVAEAIGWNAITGLTAGTLIIKERQTPVSDDYNIGNLEQIIGSVTAVVITAKAGKSPGAITIYYNGIAALPSAAGEYAVTFDVAAAEGWNAATGLAAGTLTIGNTFTSTAQLASYLAALPTNTSATPNQVKVLVNLDNDWGSLLTVLNNSSKYVELDLSDSTGMATFAPGSANTGEKYITSLVLPETSTSIQAGTGSASIFRHFTELREISGANVTNIGDWTFLNCTSLTSVSFPEVISIGNNAFYNCTGLTHVYFPAATSIGGVAFYGCTDLTSVYFPAATSIGESAFSDCTNLTIAEFPAAINVGNWAFFNCANLSSVSFPKTASIGRNAFNNCVNLVSVTLGTITEANFNIENSFPGNLRSMYFAQQSTHRAGTYIRTLPSTFWSKEGDIDVTITDTSQLTYYLEVFAPNPNTADNPIPLMLSMSMSNWSQILTVLNSRSRYVVLNLSGSTGMEVFTPGTNNTGEKYIVSLVLPDTTIIIQSGTWSESAFRHFTALKNITGKNVTSIGSYAFAGTYNSATQSNITSLTSASFPVATSIGSNAFNNCVSLVSILIPAVESIGYHAFRGCVSLTSISFPASTNIAEGAFGGNNLLSFNLTGAGNLSVVEEGKALVRNGTELLAYPAASGSVVMSGITRIGESAFSSGIWDIPNTHLTSVSFPDVTSIGHDAFYRCINLISVYFPEAITIEDQAFPSCISLTTVDFPKVTDIGAQAFYYCDGLVSASFPAVTSISDLAFEGCTNLTNVTLGEITSANFSTNNTFPGNLRDRYFAAGGGAGTYVRTLPSTTWRKQ